MTHEDIKKILTQSTPLVKVNPASKEIISRLKESELILSSNKSVSFIQKL